MAHIGRTVKNVEAPRPLKSQSRSSLKNNYMLIEELIQLIENVALTLQSGINNTEPMAALVQNLRIHGPQLETVSKDTLDRAFVVFRNASQDERLNIMTRLNLLELIELRAKGWEDNGFNSYYKTKQVTNIDLPDGHIDPTQSGYLSTSPTFGGAGAAAAAAIAAVGSAQQTQLLLAPGEVIRNSGKFLKPTKIPGKTYCKDEVVIRNADSGKVMGIKGRRVHMIEELSETIISFQRVNPGAKERLVQITGPTEEKINYAKQLIEDTIRRNASPVRLDPAMGSGHAGGGGSCSSLASSNSDEAVTPRTPGVGGPGNSSLANRLSFNSAQNFMTASAAAAAAQQQQVMNMMGAVVGSTSTPTAAAAAAAAGEYKYTVNVGQHLIKITGDCCDLVRVAKLVLDDYFSSAEFLASVEAGAAFDGSIVSPITTPSTPMSAPQFMMGTPLHAAAPPLADSGIGLNYMAVQGVNSSLHDGDDEVFADSNAAGQSNGLSRSRRSHFSRKDSTPEAAASSTAVRGKNENATAGTVSGDSSRIVHEYEHLLYYSKSPHSWALPLEWQKICEKFPAIVRNKVTKVTATTGTVTNTAPIFRVASITTTNSNISTPTTITTTTTATTAIAITPSTTMPNIIASNNNINSSYANATVVGSAGVGVVSANVTSSLSMNTKNNTTMPAQPAQQPAVVTQQQQQPQQAMHMHSSCPLIHNRQQFELHTPLHIKRKGFFNRQIVSIDEEGYDALQQQQQQHLQQQYHTERHYNNTNNLYQRAYNHHRTDTNANNSNQQQIHYQQQQKFMSVRNGPSTANFSYANMSYNSAGVTAPTQAAAPTNSLSVSFNNGNSANSSAFSNANMDNKPQKLLNKQIKLISSIVESTVIQEPTEAVSKSLESNANDNKVTADATDPPEGDRTKYAKSKLASKARNIRRDAGANNDIIEIIDDEDNDTDVEFVSETKYMQTEIVITADVVANQRRAVERPKFLREYRSNSTCD
uniref:K Homology domain-containing protein n=1 Tax=Bactrocera latifrons TaxID=174628 RepID=A0A0K8V1L2_BACLA